MRFWYQDWSHDEGTGIQPDYIHDLIYLKCEQKKARFMLQDGSRNHLNTEEVDEKDRNTRLYYLQEIEKEIQKVHQLISQITRNGNTK